MTTQRKVAFELAAIGALAAVFLASFRFRPPFVDLVLAALAVVLIAATAAESRALWAALGPVAPDGRRRAWLASLAFTGVALAVLGALGLVMATRAEAPWLDRLSNWHLVAAMTLYFPWALLQQYIFQFYLFGRWLTLVPRPVAIALTGLTFAAVHFPRWPVMAVTVVAGSVWATIYLRSRRVLPLAVSHAVLGAALHYWVFGHDLLADWLAR